jgi:cytochrome c-type protein NapB
MPDLPLQGRTRLLTIFAAVLGAAALIGFITGTQPSRYNPVLPPMPENGPRVEGVVEDARTNRELADRPWGADEDRSGWAFAKSRSIVAPSASAEETRRTRSQGPETPAALKGRMQTRAFEGAPPAIPHPISQGGAAECLACHEDGFQLGTRIARPVPHAALTSCTQCHVTTQAAFTLTPASDAAKAATDFASASPPAYGKRAYEGAPPTLPHSTWMREECMACHGPAGAPGLRTSHPERQSCTQCHAPSAGLDQAPVLAGSAG